MPKRHKNRTMKGGFLANLSNMWEQTKKSVTGATSTLTSPTSSYQPPPTPSPSYQPPPPTPSPSYTPSPTPPPYGGKRKRGGYKSNTGIAYNSASISNVKMNGGRTHRRKRKGGFIGEVINQAIVPLSIFAMQHKYRSKKGGKTRKNRKTRRH